MAARIIRWFVKIIQSYIVIITAALVVGLVFPSKAVALAPYGTLFLQIIFFLTSLKLEVRGVISELKDVRMMLATNAFMLIVLPFVVFYITKALAPSLAVPLMLLAAMPAGMTSPLLTEVVSGNKELALVLTITTSLLSPITIPLVVSLLAGTAVTVSALTMFWNLLLVIVVPFVLAQVVRLLADKKINGTYFTFKPVSIFLLGLLVAGAVAKQADVLLNGLNANFIAELIILFIFISLLLAAGYYVAFWRKCTDRLTIAVCLTFMNFTLAIYLAGSYFSDPLVLLTSVLVIFPWTLLLLPFKLLIRKFVCPVK